MEVGGARLELATRRPKGTHGVDPSYEDMEHRIKSLREKLAQAEKEYQAARGWSERRRLRKAMEQRRKAVEILELAKKKAFG